MTIKLPTKKRKPKARVEDYTILLYGEPKIGKTTFCSQMDEPLFLSTEPGTNALEVYEIPIRNWEDFREAYKAIADAVKKNELQFKTIIIDTVDNLYKMCQDAKVKELGITHPSDLEWSKGWDVVNTTFLTALTALASLPPGLVLISHAQRNEIKPRGKPSYTKFTTTLTNSAWKIVSALVDLIVYAHKAVDEEGTEDLRILETLPSAEWEAGGRITVPGPLPLDYQVFREEFEKALKNKVGGAE